MQRTICITLDGTAQQAFPNTPGKLGVNLFAQMKVTGTHLGFLWDEQDTAPSSTDTAIELAPATSTVPGTPYQDPAIHASFGKRTELSKIYVKGTSTEKVLVRIWEMD